MKSKAVWKAFVASAMLSLASGCSEFLLNVTTNVVSARTMDFHIDLRSSVEIIPRKTKMQELMVKDCPNCPDYGWETKYGFVGFNFMGINVAADGMNEVGLSAAWLYLVGTEYPVANLSDPRPIVTSLCSYILGNYASVEEVKRGFQDVQIAEFEPKLQILFSKSRSSGFPLHIAVHDAKGNNLVIEFLNGTMIFHDNPNGVMTNEPRLEDHLEQLMRTDFLDIPGTYSSNDRFLRLSILNRFANSPYEANTTYNFSTPEQADISRAVHLIDTVTLPPGIDRKLSRASSGSTQYSVIRDHTNLKLYFKATENLLLRSLDFSEIDFADPRNRKSIPVDYGNWFVDVTPAVLQSNSRSVDLPSRSILLKKLKELIGGGGSKAFAKVETPVVSDDNTIKVVDSQTNTDSSQQPLRVLNHNSEATASAKSSGIDLTTFFGGAVFGLVLCFVIMNFMKWHQRKEYHAIPSSV